MYVCIYIYICIYACTYTYTIIEKCMYSNMYIDINIHTYIHPCIHTYIHTYIHTTTTTGASYPGHGTIYHCISVNQPYTQEMMMTLSATRNLTSRTPTNGSWFQGNKKNPHRFDYIYTKQGFPRCSFNPIQ